MNTLIFSLILSLCFSITSNAEEWVHCFTDNAGNNTFYDEESIAPIGKGLTKIRVRTDYSEKGKSDFIRSRISRGFGVQGYDKLSHSVTVWYINCAKKENDLYSFFEYDKDYGILSTYKAKELDMEPVIPGTIGDIFYRKACMRIQK
jgi:hypothetical protein